MLVVALAYAKHGRLHYADAAGVSAEIGEKVVVAHPDTERVATLLWGPSQPLELVGELPTLVRKANDDDLARDQDARTRAARARRVASRLARERDLPMQVLSSEWIASDHRVTIWFSTPKRVDFRELLRALTAEIGMRVLLRQVNERERAKIVGGVGVCGRDLCCSTFLKSFEPITLQMARDQHLGTDPLRLTGACGRLMCCLRYEHPAYVEFTARAPKGGGDGGGCGCSDGCAPRAAHDQAHH